MRLRKRRLKGRGNQITEPFKMLVDRRTMVCMVAVDAEVKRLGASILGGRY